MLFSYHEVGKQSQKSVYISLSTLFADMAFDLFLIYGLAGVPMLGADGSAYSTVAVELVALMWCMVESRRGESVRPDAAGLKWFSKGIVKDIFKILLPTLGSSMAWGLGFSMHSMIMGHLVSDAMAAASIASIAQELITCICKGVSAGAGIIIGKLLGQNLFDRAKEYGKRFSTISIGVGGLHLALLLLLTPIAAAFFVLSETAKQYLIGMLLFSGLYVFAYSINTIVVCGIFPAGGDSTYDAISVFFASWRFALPLALLGTFIFDLPIIVI